MNILKNFLCGVAMGTFEVVPGMSGGTLAVLLNIYDKLILSISHLKDNFISSAKYLTTIISGMAVGIFTFSYIILFLYKHFVLETNFLILGLIVGLIPMILMKSIGKRFKMINTIPFFMTLFFILLIVYFSLGSDYKFKVESGITLFEIFKYIFVGSLASFCLMLPGCSGTMVMLAFGIYYNVMNAIHTINLVVLIPLGFGILLGLIFGAKSIEFCFKEFQQPTYFAILGLLVGSAVSPALSYLKAVVDMVYHDSVTQDSMKRLSGIVGHGAISVIVLILGILISYLLTRNAKEINMNI